MAIADVFEDNFAELLAWYASSGGETARASDHWRSHSGVPFRALNAVTRIRLAGSAPVAEATAWFVERAMPWRWLLHESSEPADLGDQLVAAGLELVSDNPAMALD